MATCPYCTAALIKEPQRKTRCPVCRELIHVKRAPGEEAQRAVTKEEAAWIEAEWQLHHERTRLLGFLHAAGATDVDHEVRAARSIDALNAVVFTRLAEVAAYADSKLHEKKMAHHLLARLEAELGNHYECFMHLQQAALRELDIIQAAKLGIDIVDVRPGPYPDPACWGSEAFSIPIERARRELLIPNPQCAAPAGKLSRGFCNCRYVVAADWLKRRPMD